MKILIVTQYFFPETFRVNTLCEELVKRGHDVLVLTGYPQYPHGKIYDGYGFNVPYEKEWKGARIERIKVMPRGKTPLGLLLNCLTFVTEGKKWVKKCNEKFDAVYVFEVSPVTVGLPAVEYKKKFGAPIYFNVQDLWPENVEIVLGIKNKLIINIINKIVDKIYSASDKILCSSNSFVKNIRERGVPKEKITFWPQFCSTPDFSDAVKPDSFSDNYFNIVFTGNIGEAQGLDLLVDAAAKLKNNGIRWYIIGEGRDKKRLEKYVKDNCLDNVVFFLGKMSERESNIHTYFADCAYLSFKKNKLFEMTLPAKLQSYMACGVPIIAAAGGESANIIKVANCGFVCQQDADILADMIVNNVINSRELTAMRKNSRTYFYDNFSVDKVVDQLENEMKQGISNKSIVKIG